MEKERKMERGRVHGLTQRGKRESVVIKEGEWKRGREGECYE